MPDDTFDRATRRARELGVSRSEFFANAPARYLAELDHACLTGRIDEALALAGEDDESAAAVPAGQRRLMRQDW